MINQSKKATIQQEKIAMIRPQLAKIQEQQKNNKLIRPRSQYIGQENMTYIPLEKR